MILKQKINTIICTAFLLLTSTTLLSQQGNVLTNDTASNIEKYEADTVWLLPYEYAVLHTNLGSDCICSIQNKSNANSALVANTGAADSLKFDNDSLFNGVHTIPIREQLIIIADFEGHDLNILNLSMEPTANVIVVLLCPSE